MSKTPLWERPTYLYRLYDVEEHLIYVGISDRWRARLNGHRKNSPWWGFVARAEVELHHDRRRAFAAESYAIHHESPPLNVEEQVRHVPDVDADPQRSFRVPVHHFTYAGDVIPLVPFSWERMLCRPA